MRLLAVIDNVTFWGKKKLSCDKKEVVIPLLGKDDSCELVF